MGKWLVAAGFNGLCGVGFGAWAAHGAAPMIGLYLFGIVIAWIVAPKI